MKEKMNKKILLVGKCLILSIYCRFIVAYRLVYHIATTWSLWSVLCGLIFSITVFVTIIVGLFATFSTHYLLFKCIISLINRVIKGFKASFFKLFNTSSAIIKFFDPNLWTQTEILSQSSHYVISPYCIVVERYNLMTEKYFLICRAFNVNGLDSFPSSISITRCLIY